MITINDKSLARKEGLDCLDFMQFLLYLYQKCYRSYKYLTFVGKKFHGLSKTVKLFLSLNFGIYVKYL